MFSRYRHRFHVWRTNKRGVVAWQGGPLYFPKNSMVALGLLESGHWEPDVTALLAIAVKPASVAFDIGANIGVSALAMLNKQADVRVVSIEPSPTVLPHLQRTRDESRFRERWEIVPKAATEHAGHEIVFTVLAGDGADVFEGIRNTGRSSAATNEIKVPTTSVDAEWQARGKPMVSVIKIDVEGAELGVLAGAAECLATCRPIVLTEWCPKNFVVYGSRAEDMLRMSASAGYDAFLVPALYPLAADPRVLPFQLATHENLLLLPRSQ
jgi:FkbM family methyltransferase